VDSGACAVRGNFVAGAGDRAIEILFARNVSIESSRRITCFLDSFGTKIREEIVSFPLYCETWIVWLEGLTESLATLGCVRKQASLSPTVPSQKLELAATSSENLNYCTAAAENASLPHQ
jgi:hypothetical protein